MIPLQLTLKNFMCYRDNAPVLDLEPLHVACLCGQNGHGKTALLDAITWALWGHARARTQEELVHQGERDMSVDLEFMARDQRHRVTRRHSRPLRSGQGSTILELQVSSGNGFRPISGNTLRETEARINDLLHMDYDTFINTAFLRQGDADAFTAARPAERKQVLAEVLDLTYYGRLESVARERSRSLQDRIRDADSRILIRSQETSLRPEREEALAAAAANLKELEARSEEARKRCRQIEEVVTALRAGEIELADLERRITAAEKDSSDLERRIEDHRKRMAEDEELIARGPEVRDGFARLSRVRREIEGLQNNAIAAAGLEKEITRLRGDVEVMRARLTGDRDRVRSRIADDLEPEAERRPVVEAELADVSEKQETLDALEADIERERSRARELGDERDELSRALEVRTEIEERKAAVEREIAVQGARLKAQVEHQRHRVAGLRRTADAIGTIEQRLSELTEQGAKLEAEAADIDARRAELEDMDGRMAYLRQSNEALLAEMKEARQKFDILMDEEQAKCPVCNHHLGADAREHLTAEYERQGLTQKRRYSENDSERRRLEARRNQLSEDISRSDASLDVLRRRTQQETVERKSALREGREALEELGTLRAWLDQFEGNLRTGSFADDEKARLRMIEQELAGVEYDPERRREIERELANARSSIEGRQHELSRQRQETQARRGRLDLELQATVQASEELVTRRRELAELERTISTGAFATKERVRLQALRGELSELGYDAEEHRAAQDRARELERYAELNRRLDTAHDDLPMRREALASDAEMLERRRSEFRADLKRRGDLRVDVDSIPARERDLSDAAVARDSLEEQVRGTAVEAGRLRDEIDRLDRLQAEVRTFEAERTELTDKAGAYDDLTAAFGRNGIQALIIETAIPQLEADANELLARLTESRLTLRLQLQEGRRDRRTGLPSEELDIKIADEVGTRSYETFSGGEAFRINFALRIALSKLLARRSGAPLPILFIDEGFGALDATGQERLTQAIQSIQDDFDKIIVITHIDQIKEAFPARIEVTKTPTGSTFEVV